MATDSGLMTVRVIVLDNHIKRTLSSSNGAMTGF